MMKSEKSRDVEMGDYQGHNFDRAEDALPFEAITLSATLVSYWGFLHTVVVMKILFDVLTVLLVMMYFGPQPGNAPPPVILPTYDHHQIYCVLLFIVLTILTSINTITLVGARMEESFSGKLSNFHRYNWINTLGVLSQTIVYFLYMFDMPDNYTVRIYGNVMGTLVVLDLVACLLMFSLQWRITVMRKQAAVAAAEAAAEDEKHVGAQLEMSNYI